MISNVGARRQRGRRCRRCLGDEASQQDGQRRNWGFAQ
jgi:hypothetical protein